MAWIKVKPTDYYGEFEGPKSLKNKASIKVMWPDGTVTKETLVAITGSSYAYVDMTGHPDHFSTRHLFVERTIKGVKAKIPLKGLKIQIL